MNRCCETCRYDLGGGYDNCRINLEAECSAGNYEAWEPKETAYDIEYMARMLAHGLASIGLLSKEIIGVALQRPVKELFDGDVDKPRTR